MDLPCVGFGMGDVVLVELLKARGLLPKFTAAVDVFVLIEDETLRTESLNLVQRLREGGCATDYSFTPAKADKQFKRALEVGASFSVKLTRPSADETSSALARNLITRDEKSGTIEEIVKYLASAGR